MEQSDRDKLYRKVDVSEIDNPFEEGLSYFTNQKDNGWLEEYTPGSPSVEEIEKVLDDHAKNIDYDEVPDVGILEGDFYTVAKAIHDLSPEERPVVTEVNVNKINEASRNRFRDFFTPEEEPEMWDLGFHHGAKWALSLIGNKEEGGQS
jgi:hypothetical protein